MPKSHGNAVPFSGDGEGGKRGRWSPTGACLLSPARRLGRSVLGEAPDPALASGGAASSRLHIHPAHPANRLRSPRTLKVSC